MIFHPFASPSPTPSSSCWDRTGSSGGGTLPMMMRSMNPIRHLTGRLLITVHLQTDDDDAVPPNQRMQCRAPTTALTNRRDTGPTPVSSLWRWSSVPISSRQPRMGSLSEPFLFTAGRVTPGGLRAQPPTHQGLHYRRYSIYQ